MADDEHSPWAPRPATGSPSAPAPWPPPSVPPSFAAAAPPAPPPPPPLRTVALPPLPAPTPPPRRSRTRSWVVAGAIAVVAALAAAGVAGGLAARGGDGGGSGASVVTTVPAPATSAAPGSAPATRPDRTRPTAPATTAPPSDPSGANGSGGSTPATTAPDTGDVTSRRTDLRLGVVDVNTVLGYEGGAAAGTGVLLTADGRVLTNNHVVSGSTSIRVTVVSTGRTYNAVLVGTAPSEDLAVLQLEGASGLATVAPGSSADVEVGDPVVAVGNAGGDGGEPSMSSGSVTALDQDITATDRYGNDAERLVGLIQIDAALQSGDSGGPLYDAAGKVIGINTAASAGGRFGPGGVSSVEGFAIPIDRALSVVGKIVSGQPSEGITLGRPAFLGVEIDPTASAATSGAVIATVLDGTPAEEVGLAAGDRITAVDGQAVTAPDDLRPLLRAQKPGTTVTITWVDVTGAEQSGSATLIAGPAD